MNKIALLAVAVLFAGAIGCSSAPKQEEVTEAPAAMETSESATTSEPAAPVAQPSNSDLSLGASSSGRGH